MRLVLLASGAALLLGAWARPAFGAPYAVVTCGASGAVGDFTLTNSNPAGLISSTQCPATANTLLTGLSLTTTAQNSAAGTLAAWRLAAAPGTTINTIRLLRSLGKRDANWDVAIKADQTTLESCTFVDTASDGCSRGGGTLDSGLVTFDGLHASAISFEIRCAAPTFCVGWPSPAEAWIAVYGATVTVEDPAPPTVEALQGGLLGPGWHTGTERLEVAATDASGIVSMALSAGGVSFGEQKQACDYSHMRPCPSSLRSTFDVDTSKLADGTYDLEAVALDAAHQSGTATALLRLDRTAPTPPSGLAASRNADGTYALSWTNPDQGTASPIVAANVQSCVGDVCGPVSVYRGPGIAQVASIDLPAGEQTIKLWLEDAAGHAEAASAAAIAVDPRTIAPPATVGPNTIPAPVVSDPSTIAGPGVLETLPPVLSDETTAAPRFKITKASRSGALLTLTGTIARTATARISANVSKAKATATLVSARTSPSHGKWSIRLRLPATLRHSTTFYATVSFAGQKELAESTLTRRLSRPRKASGGPAEAFTLTAAG